ncbi:helix-turn-helix domain-containing protein [Streptomyces nigrescens]|uniref:Helix-turn-helix domain-containing protein n=1 Tax=Streptomyces nigrescens TaxID=1920 RepID=A0A640THU0_STRNI|nr:helix-turn-helix transcriptional regulator [Streptomyces libani]WAT97253.1 helix-turn-helix domain-containing protein [Streptomyces libani subsp. libani]GFE22724.1 hypothetical protein Sliba_31770 [Streptomyces libani subsp. libani]GGW08019.1 hypothetical protein GCM10010500_77960 [Streptomyces libani subsp. libani]
MELNNEDDDRATPRTVLGRRLRRMRETANLSQRALADKVGYPHTYISRVERGEQLPSEALTEDLDTHFATDGLLAELLSMALDASIPDYGRAVVEREGKAARIQVFGSSLIPGLLQTEDYAPCSASHYPANPRNGRTSGSPRECAANVSSKGGKHRITGQSWMRRH